MRGEAREPRRVYFGTPAGGAGIRGFAEVGSSVLALCYDARHRDKLNAFLAQRAVGAMIGDNAMAFMDEDLIARSVQLRLNSNTAATATDQAEPGAEPPKTKGQDKDKKNMTSDKKKGSKKKPDDDGGGDSDDDDSDSDSDSDDDDDDDGAP